MEQDAPPTDMPEPLHDADSPREGFPANESTSTPDEGVDRAEGDVDRLRRQERVLRVLRALMEASSRFVWGVDADGEPTLDAAGAWRDATGHHSGRDNWIDAVVTEDRDRVWREWRSAFETRRELELSYRVDADDEIRHLEVRGFPIHDDHGEFEGYVGVIDDVTDLHRAERDLRRRNDVLRMLRAVPEAAHQGAGFLESIKVALEEICRAAGFDHGRLWMQESEGGPFRYTGLECANPRGDGSASTFPSSASPLSTDSDLMDRVAASPSPVWMEGAHLRDDSDDRAVDQEDEPLTAVYVCVRQGVEPVAILELLAMTRMASDDMWLEVLSQIAMQLGRSYERDRNQHQMRRAEQKARESQKLEAVGRLAGGIAHDFNNLLMVVLGEAELALRSDGLDHGIRSALGEIRASGRRAASLTAQLLAFSRREIESPEQVDLAESLRSSKRMLRRLIGEDVRLVTEGLDEARGYHVRVTSGLMDQVVMNLAVNAREAMPDGGTVTIRLDNEHVTPERTTAIVGAEAGEYAVVTVADTGEGIPEDIRDVLFEPFFTTKDNGSGFGLSTSYGIVKSAGGFIEFDSEVGVGSEFRVYLPLLDPAEPPADSSREQETSAPPDEPLRVLIVEDDDGVRSVAIRILSHAGYEVSASSGLDEVEEHLRTTSTAPDVLLTDCVLERGTGRDVDARVRDTFPDIGTVFMSGYTDDVLLRQGVRPEGSAFLPKPFSPEALVEAIASVYDDARSSGGRPQTIPSTRTP